MEVVVEGRETAMVVKELLETLNERKAGYKEASEQVKDQCLAEFFMEVADRTSSQIKDLVIFAEGNKEVGPGPLGSLFRTWMNFRSSLSKNKTSLLIKDCLLGEEAAIKIYEGALNANIPENIRLIIRRHRKDMLEVSAELEKRYQSIKK